MRSQGGILVLAVALALMFNNLYFAVSPKTAKGVFHWLDAAVIAALVFVLVANIRGLMSGEAVWHRVVAAIAAGVLVNFYAYNYLAKMAGSGLESGTLWLVLVPCTVPMLAYEGFLMIRTSGRERDGK
ncbi:MAG: hypothetical protein J4F48_01505 [Nitrospinae bacterium]|nr:hypothetical protein [Nitrospinota bacterium]